jgi:hypothetical protein
MRVARGKVVHGQVVLEGEPLPEGSHVTVLADESKGFELDEGSIQELLLAASEAELEEGVSPEQILAELRALR